MRAVLQRTASAVPVPRLVDCRWRAELLVGGSACRGGVPTPVFHLTLVTSPTAAAAAGASPGDEQLDALPQARMTMALSLEQMQHLSASLKEALRAAQRAAYRDLGGES